MALAKRLFIDADVGDRPRLFTCPAAYHRPAHYTPGLVPADRRNLARALDGTALPDQVDDQSLHQQREPTARFRPGTRTCFTPCVGHCTRGISACRWVSNWHVSR